VLLEPDTTPSAPANVRIVVFGSPLHTLGHSEVRLWLNDEFREAIANLNIDDWLSELSDVIAEIPANPQQFRYGQMKRSIRKLGKKPEKV
jgi:hypothetical protein